MTLLKIDRLTCESLEKDCITDNPNPRFAFTLSCDRQEVRLKKAVFSLGDWCTETAENTAVYSGPPLLPSREYTLTVTAESNFKERATARMTFRTGLAGRAFEAKWISDPAYSIGDGKSSPRPISFRKRFSLSEGVSRATLYVTAIGIYCARLNGNRVGEDYFTPGFTAYRKHLQYQVYDVTSLLERENELLITVAGGWAVGSYTNRRRNRLYADRQALLAQMEVEFGDGRRTLVTSDESWQAAEGYRVLAADLYDGECYDASVSAEQVRWKAAAAEDMRLHPSLCAAYGAPVRRHEKILPVSVSCKEDGRLIYDFGQNFAGVVSFRVNGKEGQKIRIRHAEILTRGELNTGLLRSARATVEYICREGVQEYSPSFTYMGFRYAEVSGVSQEDIELCAYALYSDVRQTGHFSCSDERLNRLQQNIVRSAKSNFVDIPTDCPQRDERMGWTGDIALFAPTACFNFDLSRFFDKWLKDLRAEQGEKGGIPDVIPAPPGTFSPAEKAFWGDACILVPYAQFKKDGDRERLALAYPAMKKYVDAVAKKAEKRAPFKRKYILYPYFWQAFGQYGDWCAPDCGYYGWMLRSKWTATASLKNCASLLAEIAHILGDAFSQRKYEKLAERVAAAFLREFTDGKGRMKREFQTAYVLALAFGIFPPEQKKTAAENLVRLVRAAGHKVMTGFPGTPYILHVLVENGYAEDARKMLMNEECPSWLYEVKTGATTIWERWDALKADGSVNLRENDKNVMISFNHYAGGAVGDFLYRKVLGISPLAAGYETFEVEPVPFEGITSAEGFTETRYGRICVRWSTVGKEIFVSVPVGTTCRVKFMGTDKIVGSGEYLFREET